MRTDLAFSFANVPKAWQKLPPSKIYVNTTDIFSDEF